MQELLRFEARPCQTPTACRTGGAGSMTSDGGQ
jgi:hypothetical protein